MVKRGFKRLFRFPFRRREDVRSDILEEFAFHLEMRTEELIRLGLDHADSVIDPSSLILISDALDELAEVEPNLAEIVDLKFFCGFSFAEIAAMRGVSERTIQRNWEKGRLYLHHAIGRGAPAAPDAHAANQP